MRTSTSFKILTHLALKSAANDGSIHLSDFFQLGIVLEMHRYVAVRIQRYDIRYDG